MPPQPPFRVGVGYDVHAMREAHPFWIGGIRIEHHSGAYGHSDADVLIHALCDALLGALALGDIGTHFPDNDNTYKNIDSKLLLKQVVQLVHKNGYVVGNADCTVCLQAPKLKPHIPAMVKTLCPLLHLEPHQLSIKATTTEQLGFVGREEGVACYAVATVYAQ